MSKKKDNIAHRTQDSYQPIPGDSYRPIPTGNTSQKFIPPKGGTGARIINVKVVDVNSEKKQ